MSSASERHAMTELEEGPRSSPRKAEPEPRLRWHAGDAGCGSLIMGIGNRMARLEPGEVLEVTIDGGGARTDFEAWCRMTGHRLLAAESGRFCIQRR